MVTAYLRKPPPVPPPTFVVELTAKEALDLANVLNFSKDVPGYEGLQGVPYATYKNVPVVRDLLDVLRVAGVYADFEAKEEA